MFDWALNTPLHMYKLFNSFSFCCNTEQLQNGRHDTSFFAHLRQEQSPLQVQVNMYLFRLTSYAPQQSIANLLSLEYLHLQSIGDGHLILMLRPISNQHRTLNVNYEAVKCILSGEASSFYFRSSL